MLRYFVSPQQDNWAALLPLVEFAINDSWHESVKNTPFFLNYGQHPLRPSDLTLTKTKCPRAQN